MSSAIARIATLLTSFGAAKSGKPWERLTAPYLIASRVISRITDSVNRLALRETRECLETAGVVMLLLEVEQQLVVIRRLGRGGYPRFLCGVFLPRKRGQATL